MRFGLRMLIMTILAVASWPPASAAPANASPSAADLVADHGISIPFEQANRMIYLRVTVSGRPLWFILDTGDKRTVIDLDVARALGLPLGDPVSVGGGGRNEVVGYLMRGGAVALPQVKDRAFPIFVGVPLGDIADATGHDVAGILGFDFIDQYVIEIDYAAHRIILHDPGLYRYQGAGQSLEISFNAAGQPRLHARIAETPAADGLFVVDIGSGAALILNRPFTDVQGLLRSSRPTLPWLSGVGVGGGIEGRVGRLSALTIGRFTIADPLTVFAQAQSGAFASNEEQGNIGAAILERFRVVLDYPHDRIILDPMAGLDTPMDYDGSGLVLVSTGGDHRSFKVAAVTPHSPASEIHIQPGDRLVLVDGRPAADRSLSQLRAMFEEQGPFELTFDRAGKRFSVVLRPRRLI